MKASAARGVRKRKRLRRLWLQVHLWLGLSVGAILTVVGVTGSLLAFWPELDPLAYPHLLNVERPQSAVRRPLDDIAAAALDAVPDDGRPYVLIFPYAPDQSFSLNYSRPAPKAGQTEWGQIFVDPYSGRVLGHRIRMDMERPWRGTLFDFILRIHYTLALGAKGAWVVAAVALLVPISIGAGIYLWWPARGRMVSALTIKRNAAPVRRNYDLHKLTGLAVAIPLVTAMVTGLYLVFPDQGALVIGRMAPISPPPSELSSVFRGTTPIGFDAVAAITDRKFPDGEMKWIFLPSDPAGVYKVVKRAPSERTRILPARTIWIDQYDGRILATRSPTDYQLGDILESWLFPLHSGEAFGLAGRWFVVALGGAPLLMFLTGVRHWRAKGGARRARQLRRDPID